MADVTIFHNPRCSKSRQTKALLEGRGAVLQVLDDLCVGPARSGIERLMVQLGIDDPRAMMRTGEPAYRELALADASADELIDAMVAHPILIERPIVVRGERAVIGRPPERVSELFD